jgi:LacI family transcriptional regulator
MWRRRHECFPSGEWRQTGVLRRLQSAKPPTALFGLNNLATTSILHALQRQDIQVPDEVAIIGFDHIELAPLLAVPLTVVRQPAAELGRSATRMSWQWIRSRASGARSVRLQVVLPTELIIRRSCG